ILNRLKKTPYQEHKDRNPDRIPGTCEWFIEHKLFRGWLETRSEALWVSADPGCGKSVLAKHLVDSALPSNNHRTTCYFFFKDDSDEQRSIVTALCCILYQLFLQKRKLFTKTVLVQLGAERETLTSSFSELWSVLLRAAEDDNSGEIVCVLDAIDECDASGSSLLTQALSRLYRNSSNRKPKLKFFITSRPTTTIRRGLLEDIPELPVVHLSGESEDEMEKIAKEIDIFVETRVRTLSAHLMLSQDEQELLLRELLRVPNRTYLYVHLTLNLIEHEEDIDEDGILKATSQLPKTVDDAYDRILSHSRNPDQARKILHIVVAAVRPLTLSEMGFALALHESHRSYGELNVKSEGRLRESIRDTCGLFVTIINSRIYLLHQTAKEYLVQHDLEEAISDVDGDVQWKHSLQPQDSHRILAEICTWNLLFDEFETDPLTDTPEFSGYEASRFLGYLVPEYLGKHVFLGYSATQWATHMRESPAEFASSAAQSIVGICDTGSSRFSTWFQIYWVLTNPTRICPRFSNLMAVSYFGLATAVKSSLKTGDSKLMNRKDRDYGRTALSWAAGNGHESAIQLFAKNERKGMGGLVKSWKRLKVDLADVDARTPLTYAIWSGNEETVKLLLSLGARATEKDKLGATPVDYAVAMHQVTLAELMLGNEAKSGSTGESNTLLLSALENGDQHVVRLLLESGTDIDSKTSKGQTLLSYAAALGKLGVVRLLIKNGADINLADWVGRTPLSIAAGRGRVAVVESLLENEADIDLADANGRSPLFYAAKNFHCLLVGLDDADLAVDSSENPSLNALKLGDITRVLLENGANISLASSNGRTPMSFFAKIGYYALANILVNAGADTNAVNWMGQTPLSVAAQLGHLEAVRLLLATGPDVNLADREGMSPLSYAVRNGHVAIARLLRENRA
ncbi:putative ankyrin repeat-containing protein, partial [Lasiosphaeria miniovina]